MAQKEKREAELAMFRASYTKAYEKNQVLSVNTIEEFEELLSKVTLTTVFSFSAICCCGGGGGGGVCTLAKYVSVV